MTICGLDFEIISFIARAIEEGRLVVDCNGNHEYFNIGTIEPLVEKFGVDIRTMKMFDGKNQVFKRPKKYEEIKRTWG